MALCRISSRRIQVVQDARRKGVIMNELIKQRITQLNNGEVPNGYENTDFGIFPCDWVKDKTFGDLFDFYGGLGKSRDELGDEGHAYLHYGDLHRGAFNVVSHEQYEQLPKYDVVLKGTETYLMEDGDVAFLDASEDLEGTSRAVLIDNPDNDPFIAGLHIIYGKSKDESLEKWYKQYITTSESVRKQFQRLAAGFKVYGVNRDTLPRIQVAYPKSTEEQSRIAEILMKWDEAIELEEQSIIILEVRKNSIMKRLLTPQEDWRYVLLGDICQIKTGRLDANAMDEDGIYPFFTCSKDIYRINQYSFDCEALLIAGNGDIGDVKYYNGKFDAYQRTYVMSEFTFNIKYVMQYLRLNFDKDVMKGMQKSSMPYIKLDLLKKAKIYYKVSAIESTVAILSIVDNEIELHQLKLSELKKQRKALQQYLLNGIVRV